MQTITATYEVVQLSGRRRSMDARLTTAVVLLTLAGCCGSVATSDRRAFSSADSWYSPPPTTAEYTSLDKDRFAEVASGHQAEAQTVLSDVTSKRITADEATRLVGKPLPASAEYVVLRAVVLNEGIGGFEVGVHGSSLHVQHNCLGRSPAPMRRKALVAILPSLPKAVFVSCGMDE